MTTAAELLAEVRRLGGTLEFLPPDKIHYDVPPEAAERLVPALRAAKPELLMLLAPTDRWRQVERHLGPPVHACPACGGLYWWRLRHADSWTCGRCSPDPRAARWEGVTLATLGDRSIALTPPARDLPAPREWVQTPAGVADLLCWEATGSEALVRLFGPRQGQPALVWFPAEHIVGELEWARRRA